MDLLAPQPRRNPGPSPATRLSGAPDPGTGPDQALKPSKQEPLLLLEQREGEGTDCRARLLHFPRQ